MDLGTKIRNLREALQLSPEDFAQRVELPVAELSKIESGARATTHTELQKIAAVLGVSVDALFEQQEAPGAPESEGQSVLIPMDKLSALLEKMKTE